MDTAQSQALDEFLHRALRPELDEIARLGQRIDELQAELHRLTRPGRRFSRHQRSRQRRAAVLDARRRGYSIARIAEELGVGRTTIVRDLRAAGDPAPAKIIGVNGVAVARDRVLGEREPDLAGRR